MVVPDNIDSVYTCVRACVCSVHHSIRNLIVGSVFFSPLYVHHLFSFLCIQWTIDCSLVKGLPNIGFVIGGHAFTLTGEQYVLQVRPIKQHGCMHTAYIIMCAQLCHTSLAMTHTAQYT